MVELIIAGALGLTGHKWSRDFVHKKLRFTPVVEKPGIGLASGVASTLATGAVVVGITAVPIIGAIAAPFVGAATAIGVGAGVGTGVALGASRARRRGFDE